MEREREIRERRREGREGRVHEARRGFGPNKITITGMYRVIRYPANSALWMAALTTHAVPRGDPS